MSVPDAASFDPIFWFFHANWDRLWWQWQLAMQAATRWSFRSTVTSGLTGFLKAPDNALEGTGDDKRAELQLDLAASGVGYALPHDAAPVVMEAAPAMFGSAVASRRMKVGTGPVVSVRVKGINRLPIPGSFDLVLKADGEPIGRRPFFQSTKPLECGACRERSVIDLDFRVDADAVVGRDLTAEIELLAPGCRADRAALPAAGGGRPHHQRAASAAGQRVGTADDAALHRRRRGPRRRTSFVTSRTLTSSWSGSCARRRRSNTPCSCSTSMRRSP
jgi:tyrosinase